MLSRARGAGRAAGCMCLPLPRVPLRSVGSMTLLMALCVPWVLIEGASASESPPPMCSKGGMNNTGCTMAHYAAPVVSDAGACCARCAADTKCEAWTFHGSSTKPGACYLDTAADCRPVNQAVGGCKNPPCHIGPPPPPPPPPPKPVPFPNYCKGKGASCKNVLYLVSDDMRSDWGTYGLPVITPNLDALAKKSMLFEHAYCQLSVCAPSRMSFMTSKRPDTSRVWNFIDTNPLTTQATPGHFRDHGYITLGLGKTFHQASGAWNANQYWSLDEQPYFPYESGKCPHGGEGGGHCIQKDSEIYDWHLRFKTIEYLKYAANKSKSSGRPFYVMSGFRKPHAPWQAPQRMWDLYNSSTIAIPTHKTIPTGAPLIAWSNQLEVALENGTSFHYDPHNAVPDWVVQDQRHAYYACVSYVDEHVGAILQALDESGTAEDTAVIFHADHGYHLGEHGEWEKKSNWDLVVRVPLMIHVPWLPKSFGQRTSSLVELVDVMPTVAAIAGLPAPADVDGVDISSLLHLSPNRSSSTSQGELEVQLEAAYHQYPACGCNQNGTACFNQTRGGCNNTPRTKFGFMGYSVRTAVWRYTAWFHWDPSTLSPLWDGEYAEELYNHTADHSYEMDRYENVGVRGEQCPPNIHTFIGVDTQVNQAEQYPAEAKALHAQLREFFSAHQTVRTHPVDKVALAAEEELRPQTPDDSDPYDLL